MFEFCSGDEASDNGHVLEDQVAGDVTGALVVDPIGHVRAAVLAPYVADAGRLRRPAEGVEGTTAEGEVRDKSAVTVVDVLTFDDEAGGNRIDHARSFEALGDLDDDVG